MTTTTFPHPSDKPLNDLLARCNNHLEAFEASGHSAATAEISILLSTLIRRAEIFDQRARDYRSRWLTIRRNLRKLHVAYQALQKQKRPIVVRRVPGGGGVSSMTFPSEPAVTQQEPKWTHAQVGFAIFAAVSLVLGLTLGA